MIVPVYGKDTSESTYAHILLASTYSHDINLYTHAT